MNEDGKVTIKIDADDVDFKKAINGVGTSLNSLKALITKLGFGALVTKAVSSTIKATNSLEDSIAKTSTLFGGVNVNVEKLSDNLKSLSAETGYTADAIGNSLYNALSAGLPVSGDMAETLAFMEQNAKLAKAGFTDMDTAVTATAKVLNAYGMSVDETSKVHKILMETQNLGITTVDQLGQALATVTPVASNFGLSFEEVGASLAVMTKAGTDTATATTQLRAVLNALGQSSSKASKILKEQTGKSFRDLIGEGKTLQEVILILDGVAKDSNLTLADMFGEIRAGTGAMQIASDATQTYSRFLNDMASDADIVEEAFQKVMGTRSQQWKRLKTELSSIAIEITESKGTQKLLDGLYTLAQNIVTKFGEIEPTLERGISIGVVGFGILFDYLRNNIEQIPTILLSMEAVGDLAKTVFGAGGIAKAMGLSFLDVAMAGMTIAVAFKEAQGEDNLDGFVSDVLAGLAVGLGVYAITGSGTLATLGLTISVNFEIGQKFNGFIDKANTKIAEITAKLFTGKDIDASSMNSLEKKLFPGFVLLGKYISQGIEDGADKEKPGEVLARGLLGSVKKVLGIHSPSTVFEKEVGENIIKGIEKGMTAGELDKAQSDLEDAYYQLGENIKLALEQGFDEAGNPYGIIDAVRDYASGSSLFGSTGKTLDGVTPIAGGSSGSSGSSGGNGNGNGNQKLKETISLYEWLGKEIGETGKTNLEFVNEFANSTASLLDNLTSYYSDYYENQANMLEDQMNKRRELGDLTVEEEVAMQEEIDKQRRKAFEAEKKNNIAQALINGALSITSIWAEWGGMPIVAGILTALATASTAMQIATINSQQYQGFETGGIVQGSGITGDKHQIWANAGELILNRAQQNSIASQLQGNNRSSNITIEFNGNVFGSEQEISEYVYNGIKKAQYNGELAQW